MTPDQLRLDETKVWLDRSHRDLRSARLLVDGGEHAEALFHCQQAAEKAVKGFLTFHQRLFRKTHDISELGPDCLAIDASLEAALAQADALSK